MKCETAQELFSDYCEGALQRAMTMTLENHLGECSQCRSEVEGLKTVWSTLDAAEVIEPPANFRETVWAKIDAYEKQAASLRPARSGFALKSLFTQRALAWAGAAVVVLVLAQFAIPGKYSPAWLGSFSDIFHGRSETPWAITALPASVSANDPQVIVLPLTIDAPSEVRVSFRVESGPAKLEQYKTVMSLQSNHNQDVELRIQPGQSGKPIILEADWTQNGETHSKTFTITAP